MSKNVIFVLMYHHHRLLDSTFHTSISIITSIQNFFRVTEVYVYSNKLIILV
jgi:hypothetical protein